MAKNIKINTADPPSKWKVGSPRTGAGFNNDCKPFEVVGHTTHLLQASDVVRDGLIKANLVYDQSTLRSERITVVFASPNEWGVGYRYGNIRFDFDWQQLCSGKNAYWVEVAEYAIHAPRILITSRDLSNHPWLGKRPYDPTVPTGPWWFNKTDGRHYFNNKHCIEFLIEDDLPLSAVKSCNLVGHHASYCCIHRDSPASCPELGKSALYAAPRFIADLVGKQLDPSMLRWTFTADGKPQPTPHLQKAWAALHKEVSQMPLTFQGTLDSQSPARKALARACLFAFSKVANDDFNNLAQQFGSLDDLLDALRAGVEEGFSQSDQLELPKSDVELEIALNM